MSDTSRPSPTVTAPTFPERSGVDRRRRPTGPWDFLRHRRRVRHRRADEHRRAYYIDRPSWRSALLALMILACSLADGLVTLVLLRSGCEEVNPVMLALLGQGTGVFLAGKLALTAAMLPGFLLLQHHYLFGSPLRVSHVMPCLIGLYGLLGIYESILLAMTF